MNWLYIGLPLAIVYVAWFGYLLLKKQYSKSLLLIAFAHLPYMLINVVAPFRGVLDPAYHGFTIGLIDLPAGVYVTLVSGFMAVGSLLIASKALMNKMNNLWIFTAIFDLFLAILIAIPLAIEILLDPVASRIQLGEYLTISGYWVALIIILIFSGPTMYSFIYAAKKSKALIFPARPER